MLRPRKNIHREVKYAHFSVGYFGMIVGKTGQRHPVTGYATVAAIRDKDLYHYAVALCAPEDNFCRADGRLRALRKLMNPKQAQFTTGTITVCETNRNSQSAEFAVKECLRLLQEDLPLDDFETLGLRWWAYVDAETEVELRSRKSNRFQEKKNA